MNEYFPKINHSLAKRETSPDVLSFDKLGLNGVWGEAPV
ncbi:hypothetical protein BpHYR1_045351 [Brachionus plicatilis]|uniref:Uncharacterized protein n=1 Tax=Brachionus plicatilis TaxID=10195 RepID=A0A3M7QBZ9_BRAPC|nr:hypothetical protein BpHYR1_045351 [Brachionus plicatilis]